MAAALNFPNTPTDGDIFTAPNGQKWIWVAAGPYWKVYSDNILVGNVSINTTVISVGNSSVNVTVNSTTFSGTSNNADYLDGQHGAYYTNATNITTGTLPYAQIPANVVNTTASFTRTGVTTFSANIILGSSGLSANGSFGTDGHVLHSNGTATYWAPDDNSGGTVTSVGSGNGLSGGPITGSGTLSVLANNGIIANSTGVFVDGNTGLVVNSTGVHVNSSYVQNTDSRTLSGNLNLTGTNTTISADFRVVNSTANIFFIAANGNIGIGNTTPGQKITMYDPTSFEINVNGDGGVAARLTRYSTDTTSPALNFRKSRGTIATPTAVASGDELGRTNYTAYDGSAFIVGAIIQSYVDTYTGVSDLDASLRFHTREGGVAAAERMRIAPSGNVGIGNTAPAYKLRVDGDISLSGGIHANGSFGTANQVLTSNGTVSYWADAAGGGSTYMKGGSATVGSLGVEGQNLFRVNANTLNYNTTFVAGENAQATGPISVASGITLTVESGARVSIV